MGTRRGKMEKKNCDYAGKSDIFLFYNLYTGIYP